MCGAVVTASNQAANARPKSKLQPTMRAAAPTRGKETSIIMTAQDGDESVERRSVVTSGPGGKGRAIVGRLAASRLDVALAHYGSKQPAVANVGEIQRSGCRGAAFEADVADEKAVGEFFETTRRAESAAATRTTSEDT